MNPIMLIDYTKDNNGEKLIIWGPSVDARNLSKIIEVIKGQRDKDALNAVSQNKPK
jgi:hypothetical protein